MTTPRMHELAKQLRRIRQGYYVSRTQVARLTFHILHQSTAGGARPTLRHCAVCQGR